ncbi:leucine-rich repeat receptor protein kinase EXS-like [Dorcoceras hygrometricum]|uniref:Leucine-rich repeat receptor protein kinase EXS-like n=1 Tax=Dorcoceras hygrometricum TaxID=472368 RepID=A0A2Z7CT70_9LAMI|nr:leucine-rich repeat receptor protein kinase EXS-like [Dorcoceras hygrometricum]
MARADWSSCAGVVDEREFPTDIFSNPSYCSHDLVFSGPPEFGRSVVSEGTSIGNPSSSSTFPYQFGVERRPD